MSDDTGQYFYLEQNLMYFIVFRCILQHILLLLLNPTKPPYFSNDNRWQMHFEQLMFHNYLINRKQSNNISYQQKQTVKVSHILNALSGTFNYPVNCCVCEFWAQEQTAELKQHDQLYLCTNSIFKSMKSDGLGLWI